MSILNHTPRRLRSCLKVINTIFNAMSSPYRSMRFLIFEDIVCYWHWLLNVSFVLICKCVLKGDSSLNLFYFPSKRLPKGKLAQYLSFIQDAGLKMVSIFVSLLSETCLILFFKNVYNRYDNSESFIVVNVDALK